MNILIDGQTFETPELHRGIGVYTVNTINEVVKNSYEHRFFIIVFDDTTLSVLDPWVLSRLHVIKESQIRPGTDYLRNARYTECLKSVIESEDISLLWIPNMLMVNVLAPIERFSCRVCVTVYDIIPFLFPVKEWSLEVQTEYRRRLNYIKDNMVECIFISEATKRDFIEKIGDPGRTTVTYLAADDKVFYKRREWIGSGDIIFTGGFDYRKNVRGAIEAFALAKAIHPDDERFNRCMLKIVGAVNGDVKKEYEEFIAAKGLKDHVILTGFLPTEELAALYQKASVLFFPSLYEGFGLPILEGMLGGCVVVSANNSSLPEVCGTHAFLCDASDYEDMGRILYAGYTFSDEEPIEEKQLRQDYAREFTWKKTAHNTLSFWNWEDDVPGIKKRLAIITPWPPQETGVANYMYNIVKELQLFYDIDIYTDAENPTPIEGISIYHLEQLTDHVKTYHHQLYEIGNNSLFHQRIFEMMEMYGGIAELHDYVISPFMFQSFFKEGKIEKLRGYLKAGYGDKGGAILDYCLKTNTMPDITEYPMAETVVAYADKVIVHNAWTCEQLKDKAVLLVPLPSFEVDDNGQTEDVTERIKKMKTDYHIEQELVIGCFGFINENKRPMVIMRAVKQLIAEGYSVNLVFWGRAADDRMIERIKEAGLEDIARVSGYLEKKDYITALSITDVVVNLRYPSMGESSGTLCEAFRCKKPVIVSDINQYREFPDDICWKLPVGKYEVELLTSYLRVLLDNEGIRDALGKNAEAYARSVLDTKRVAHLYYKALEGMI